MNIILRLFAISVVSLLVLGCTPTMIPMYNIHDEAIPQELTQEQVEKAIKYGASVAGWETQNIAPGRILATYKIRVHTIVVAINYSRNSYSIDYNNSNEMKVYCTEEDKENGVSTEVTTGGGTCKNTNQPAYIHENYQHWIDNLNKAIGLALQS